MAHFFRIVKSSRALLYIVAAVLMAHAHQAASCMENEFACSSLKCIPKDLKCDGENDCGDFSDEINCTYRGKCNLNEFECSDGSCISSALVCNGKFECPRGLDETKCDSKTTAPTTPTFEQLGIFYTEEGKVKTFPVFDKSLGISIYLRFTAHRCSGNLFQMTSQDTDQFFLLSLTGNGNIEFLFKTSSSLGMIVIPPPPGDSFCNGKRHMLSFRRYLDEVRYRVNRRRSVTKRIGVLKEPFSRPFRVYIGTTLQGCVSGIDVIFYRTRSKTYPVGVSKGCAKLTDKTTPLSPDTTASTSFITPSVSTRVRKESVIQTSPTSAFSKQSPSTEGVSPNSRITQGNTPVTQTGKVTYSPPLTFPASTSDTSYTSESAHAQSSNLVTQSQGTRAQTPSVTQSDDVLDPYFIGEGESTSSPDTIHVTSPTASSTVGPERSTGSNYVTHSSSTVEFVTVTIGRDTKDTIASATSNSISQTSTKEPLKHVTHSPSTVDSVTITTGKSGTEDTTESRISKFQTTTRKLPKYERCEPLRSKFCTYIGYNQTRLSGREGFKTQLKAEKQMSRFLPFIRANCSRVLRDFICVTYLPPCSSPHSPTVPPCRELCLRSKHECASLMKAFAFDWPEYLDCHKFPSRENGKCTMVHDTGVPVVPTEATQLDRNQGCGGILSRSSGVIKTPHFPNPYPDNTLCKWHIILPKVYHVIDIILEEVSLEADVSCGYDYLLFLDGLSNQVGPRICGFLAYPRVITVKGNIASIVFRSDSALNKKGVLIKYTAHCPFLSCSGDDVTLVTQYLTSHATKSRIDTRPTYY